MMARYFEWDQSTATGLRRSARSVTRANGDTAHILSESCGFVLFNVEGADGSRFKHRYLDAEAFDQRWAA